MPIGHITLATRDVQRSCDFFAKAFGWPRIARPGNIPMQSDWLQICPGQELHLVHSPGFAASPFEEEFGRHIALLYPARDFGALQQRLREAQAELIAPRRETPFERFFFRDPNGYVFEVVDSEYVPPTGPAADRSIERGPHA